MNYRGFKKIKEDSEKAVLQNQRGHQITLAKKQLSQSHLDGISKLPLYAAEGADIQAPQQEMVPQQPVTQEMQEMPIEGQINPQQAAQSTTQEQNQEAQAHWNDLMQGHIKPQTYQSMFAKQSTLGKIGTLFGMMVSGAGSGLAHQPNALLELMNKEIDRDLEAQKQSMEGSQNYYRLNQQNELNKANVKKTGAETLGLMKDVEAKGLNNAKTGMQLAAAHKVLTDLNMIPNGPQKAIALQKFGGLQGAVNQDIQQRNAQLGQALVSDPEGDFQKKQQSLRAAGDLGVLPGAENIARANDERHVPGFGDSSIPVPQNIREELTDHLTYEKAARNYIDFSKKYHGNWANLNPVERKKIANEANNIGALLQGKFRAETKGGVYKEGEQKFIEKVIPDNPASWNAYFSAIPKVQETMKDNRMSMETKAGNYHLPVPKYYQGKYYTRGSKGEAVEVK